MSKLKIAYVIANVRRTGPSNQTLNIIRNSRYKDSSIVITLFREYENDTMIDDYKKNNINTICLNFNLFTFNGQKKLMKVLKDNKIDIVHSTGVKADYICNKVCNRLKVDHIITLRNYPRDDILTKCNFVKGKIILHKHLKVLIDCDNVICCSKTIYKKMSSDYPNKKFSYIQNGINAEKFKTVNNKTKINLRKKYNFDENKRILISTSSFIPRKRIDETIQGFVRSKTDGVLLLVGNGNLFNKLKNKYKKYYNIIFYGKANSVEELLQLSDCFISSSESEGLPNGVLEAIACGLPVILSDIPQHREILEEFKNVGMCYKIGDVKELSRCINYNIINESDINNSPFTMKKMSNKYVDYYAKLKGIN